MNSTKPYAMYFNKAVFEANPQAFIIIGVLLVVIVALAFAVASKKINKEDEQNAIG